jgi:hypothetical protein
MRPVALLRGPRHARLLSLTKSSVPSRSPFAAPSLNQSSLSDSASKKDYRENWTKVIEEYKKDKKKLARDLGVAESSGRIPLYKDWLVSGFLFVPGVI